MRSHRPVHSSAPRSSASTWQTVSTRQPPTRCARTSGGTRSWCFATSTCPRRRMWRRCGSSTNRSTILCGCAATKTTGWCMSSTSRRRAARRRGMWAARGDPPFNIESLTYQVVPEIGGHTHAPLLQICWPAVQLAPSCQFQRLRPRRAAAMKAGSAKSFGLLGAAVRSHVLASHPGQL